MSLAHMFKFVEFENGLIYKKWVMVGAVIRIIDMLLKDLADSIKL